MVQLLPRESFVIQTSEALQTVIERLEANIEPRQTFRSTFDRRSHAPYEGDISDSGFQMRRLAIGRRNAVAPEIEGRFTTYAGGTAVHITLKLHPAVLIFMCVWLAGWYGLTLLMLSSDSLDRDTTLVFWGLPPFIIIGFWINFWVEVERTRTALFQMILKRPPESRQGRSLVLSILKGIVFVLSVAFSVWFITNYFADVFPDLNPPTIFQDR